MFSINTREIWKLEGDLKAFNIRALPFATKSTINGTAFKAQALGRKNVEAKMIERNRFSKQSIQVNQAKGLRISTQEAATGSIADYMETQEFGGTESKKGKHGVRIATSYSSGEGENAQPRKRLPRKPNRIQNIRLKKKGKTGNSRKQRNLIAIREAATSGRKYVYLKLDRRKAIFKVVGGKRKPRIKMVQDLSSQAVTIPKKAWLRPAAMKARETIPERYAEALRFQLKRLGLFE